MLKISQLPPGAQAVALRLEGRIVGPWVFELQRACEEILAARQALGLHLADVEFLDANGIALIADLRSRGVRLLECPPFVAAQLKAKDPGTTT